METRHLYWILTCPHFQCTSQYCLLHPLFSLFRHNERGLQRILTKDILILFQINLGTNVPAWDRTPDPCTIGRYSRKEPSIIVHSEHYLCGDFIHIISWISSPLQDCAFGLRRCSTSGPESSWPLTRRTRRRPASAKTSRRGPASTGKRGRVAPGARQTRRRSSGPSHVFPQVNSTRVEEKYTVCRLCSSHF